MKHIILISILSLLLPSCASTYFYSTISTLDKNLVQNEDGDFIAETDSLLVAYWFNGQNAPVFINIYNKGKAPLYVDWSRSSIITGDIAASYQDNIIDISDGYGANYSERVVSVDGYDVVSVESRGSLSDNVSFIPPLSRKTFKSEALADFDYKKTDDTLFYSSKMLNKFGISNQVKTMYFDENNTPLRFRSYLTFYNNADRPFNTEHEFYISNLIKTKSWSPGSENTPDGLVTRGDIFYIEKLNPNRGAGYAILGTTLVVGLVVLGAAIPAEYDD